MRLAEAPSEQTLADVALAAHALAYVVIANRRYTDLFEWGQRRSRCRWPPRSSTGCCRAPTPARPGSSPSPAWLEPAGDVGGDTFDFALERDTLHLSMTDAMGHTVDAALLATVLVGALRNARRARRRSRRAGATRPRRAGRVRAATARFVTGQVARIDLRQRRPRPSSTPDIRRRSGCATVASSGSGCRPTRRSATVPGPATTPFSSCRWSPATDSCSSPTACWSATPTGVDIAAILVDDRRDLHPREAVQHLTREVLEAGGGELRDDATAMCLDWHGGPPRDRHTDSGADR